MQYLDKEGKKGNNEDSETELFLFLYLISAILSPIDNGFPLSKYEEKKSSRRPVTINSRLEIAVSYSAFISPPFYASLRVF